MARAVFKLDVMRKDHLLETRLVSFARITKSPFDSGPGLFYTLTLTLSSSRHCSTLKLSVYLRHRPCVVAGIGIWQRVCLAAIHVLEVALKASPALLVIVFQFWTLQSMLHDPWDVINLHASTLDFKALHGNN